MSVWGMVILVKQLRFVHLRMKFKVSDPKECVIHRVSLQSVFSKGYSLYRGNVVRFSATNCWIKNSKGNLCGMGSLQDKMYRLNCEPILQEQASVVLESASDVDLWLGRLSESALREIISHELVE